MYKVYVDGQEGTTGLQIHERLLKHSNIELIKIDSQKRKDPLERQKMLNSADIAFLCLPDVAAKEAVAMVTNQKTRLIDASTAHRTNPNWVYGIPELNKLQRSLIKNSLRVANPGCHATGFVLLIRPLIENGIIGKDYPITCHSITGYSGGGKKVIDNYENPETDTNYLNGPRPYALSLQHKHLPEMQMYSGLGKPPLFDPIIGNFYKGMAVCVPLMPELFKKKLSTTDLYEEFSAFYVHEKFVKIKDPGAVENLDNGYFNPQGANDTNLNEIFIFGHENQIMLISRLDNLGKGASGAAVQNMNIMLGFDEGTGLE